MDDSKKLLLLICAFATISLVMLQTIFPSLVPVQVVAFLLGIAGFLIVGRMPFAFWRAIAPMLLTGMIVVMLGTYILGKTSKGSTRWISIGVAQAQPSQFAKPSWL
jgi:cell division protein FtsW (lipid II flippase)